ncbi:TPR domain-containing protein [Diaporthe helianthi]|uniref:TPR domain-containing protein n=1 Tax=Diaporthe helianthi TaxID=158607 RepID=A0A2P5IDG2_DIAHE|nr:TPR domain-containing protein [Diaporthe helianthi]
MNAIRSAKLPRRELLRAVLEVRHSPLTVNTSRTLHSVRYSGPRVGNTSLHTPIPARQVRCSSKSSFTPPGRPPPDGQHSQTTPPPPSLGQILRSALRLPSLFRGQTLKTLFRQSPEELVLALAGAAGVVGYVIYMYFTYFYSSQFTKYPPEIAKSLRRALHYSNNYEDPKLALKYYKLAIEQCNEHGLDPFSDEVVGIKIQLAAWLERISNVDNAIHVLELVLTENQKWLKLAGSEPEKLPGAPRPGTKVGEGESEKTITQDDFDRWLRSSRTRIMGKSVGISTKLGELYAHEQVLQQDKAHERLMWAVETALGEFRRRSTEGVKPGEGAWMTPEEIGGALESLAHSYERKSEFDLALPLFFQALRLCQDQCHIAVIMNNLAVAFAQHPPKAPYETLAGIVPGEGDAAAKPSSTEQWTRKDLLESGHRWAKNAYQHAKEPTGENRTPECDEACAVALVNLGDIAAMSGDIQEARRQYERSIKLSEKSGFADGVAQARAGLERLAQKSS